MSKAFEVQRSKSPWNASKIIKEDNAKNPRKNTPQQSKKHAVPKQNRCYTDAELADLEAFAQIYSKQHQSAAIDNARKQAQDGVFATTLEHQVMMWATWAGMTDTFGGPKNRKDMNGAEIEDWWKEQEEGGLVPRLKCDLERATVVRVAYHIAWAVRDGDEPFFKRILTALRAKRKHPEQPNGGGKILLDSVPLTVKQLGLRRKRGRGFTAHDLACCFPSALCLVMNRRLHDFGEGVTRQRVTRRELALAVREQRYNALRGSELINVENAEDGFFSTCDLEDRSKVPPISPTESSELSRWITKAGFQRFMAEQPIARKRRK